VEAVLEEGLHVRGGYLRDDFAAEGVREEGARRPFREAARAEVEEGVRVDPARRRAVRAPDVVVVNLELGFAVDERLVREDQVPIRLARVRLHGAFAHDDLAVERAAAVPVEDALVELEAVRARGRVVDDGVAVDVLAGRGGEEAVELRARAFAGERRGDFVADRRAAEGVDVRRRTGAPRVREEEVTDVEGLPACVRAFVKDSSSVPRNTSTTVAAAFSSRTTRLRR
jgi:hypothetical protein